MNLVVAISLSVALGILFLISRNVTRSGAVAGALLAFAFALAPTPAPFVCFATFVFVGTFSSRIGRQRKSKLGVYQNEKGPRSWRNAVANCGLGALLVLLGRCAPDLIGPGMASALAIGSLAAVCADTCASEWGTWLGGTPRSVLTLKPMPVGTDGAVTWTGNIAGLVAAAVIAGVASLSSGISGTGFVWIVCAGVLGNLADSIAGATVEPHFGRHGGSYVNFICSLAGALVMWLAIS